MFNELRRKPLITRGVRELHVARVVLAVLAVLTIAEGTVLLLVRGLPDFEGRSSIGLWLLLLGSAMGMFAWHGRWIPAVTAEEQARDVRLTRHMDVAIRSVELLFLSLALLGLLVPSIFAALWDEHRSSVTLLLVMVLLDVAVRLARRHGFGEKSEKTE